MLRLFAILIFFRQYFFTNSWTDLSYGEYVLERKLPLMIFSLKFLTYRKFLYLYEKLNASTVSLFYSIICYIIHLYKVYSNWIYLNQEYTNILQRHSKYNILSRRKPWFALWNRNKDIEIGSWLHKQHNCN